MTQLSDGDPHPTHLPGFGAVSILQKVLEVYPDNYAANYWLATALSTQNRYAECLRIFDKVSTSNQFSAEGWLHRSRALLALDKLEPSLLSIRNALRLDPGSIDANEALGEVICRLAVRKTVYLLIEGGIGDFLQSTPFLLEQRSNGLKVAVKTHFQDAASFFGDLGIEVEQYFFYSSLEESVQRDRELTNLGLAAPCPRRMYFSKSPFVPSSLAFPDKRPIIGIHLGGSQFSTRVQGQMGLVIKSLPVGVFQGMHALNKFNIIVFGTKAELAMLELRESDRVRFACFDRISESLAVAAQCSALVGSDSAMKTMTSMLKIPTVVWMGDYPDLFRDCVFIGPYVKSGVMKVFRFRNISVELEAGIHFTEAALADLGIR